MQTFGQAAQTALAKSMDSPPRFAKPSDILQIKTPTTLEESRALREWAMAQPEKWEPVAPASLTRHLQFMQASLPSRSVDEDSGRDRIAVYIRLLGSYSEKAIAHLSMKACATLRWFPTPSECLDILASHTDASTPRDQALGLCHDFAQQRFEAFRDTLKRCLGTPELLDSVPDQWKRICVEQGFLRFTQHAGFTIEPRYQPPQLEG